MIRAALFLSSWVAALFGGSYCCAAQAAPTDAPGAPSTSQAAPLHIASPENRSEVPEQPVVEGTVADPRATVWVIVHPLEVADYWVQQPITVGDDGSWEVQVHIGRPGDIDVGKHFEILAVANPRSKLRKGDVLSGWPKAQYRSQRVVVTRK